MAQILGPAEPALTKQQLIDQLGLKFNDIIRDEMSDENDPDRVWWLRIARRNDVYDRGLQLLAPQFVEGVLDFTALSGVPLNAPDDLGSDLYDYTDNITKGYRRKFVAVLGQRMPNVTAEPDDPNDERATLATQAANTASLFIKQKCNLQIKNLYLMYKYFSFGTVFCHLDYNVDGDKYGFKKQDKIEPVLKPLGLGYYFCQNCGAEVPMGDPETGGAAPQGCPDCGQPMQAKPPEQAPMPVVTGQESYPLGCIEWEFYDMTNVSVPFDIYHIDEDTPWLSLEREAHKGKMLRKYGDALRQKMDEQSTQSTDIDTTARQYAENVRGGMSSPLGIVRGKRPNRVTVRDTWMPSFMFELLKDKEFRQLAQENFQKGVRITYVEGHIVDLNEEALHEHWQDFVPEPSARIMADPLANDWTQIQDLHNDVLNITAETVERSNQPTIVDQDKINVLALGGQRMLPAQYIGAKRPPGGSMGDIIAQNQPVEFSDQIPAWHQSWIDSAKTNSGLEDAIFGGAGADAPTARQSEMNKNAALMQLGTYWVMTGESYSKAFLKACRLLGEYEKDQIAFGVKNSLGTYDSLKINTEDLRYGRYHFTFDEAIPLTWGQQRDLGMWVYQQGPEMAEKLGYNDPLNIPTVARLFGTPDLRVPYMDDRNKAMGVIAKLLASKPTQNLQPDGSIQRAPSIAPEPIEDAAFCAKVAREWCVSPAGCAAQSDDPDSGYQNVILWYQAEQQRAAQQPPPPKGSVALTLKGSDLGSPAVQAAIQNANIVPPGTQVQQQAPLAPVQTQPPLLPVGPDGLPAHQSQQPQPIPPEPLAGAEMQTPGR